MIIGGWVRLVISMYAKVIINCWVRLVIFLYAKVMIMCCWVRVVVVRLG
jgi:hypothetical protein